jgi:hypothetical protein
MQSGDFSVLWRFLVSVLSFSFLFISAHCKKEESIKEGDTTTTKVEGTFENGDKYVIMRSFEENLNPQKTVRFFAFGHKFTLKDVETEESYFQSYVKFAELAKPYISKRYENVFVFEEHAGLPLLFFGKRGKSARENASNSTQAAIFLSSDFQNAASYYISKFPEISTFLARPLFLAATDTLWRVFFDTSSKIAKDYGVWVVSCQNSPYPYLEKVQGNSKDGFPISAFVDEVVKDKSYFYVATTSDVWNTCFVFSPQGEIKHYTRKVNLVPTEKTDLQFSSGTYEELSVFRIPGTEVDICVAISLDAFVPRYIQELDSKGCDVLLQPDANSGAWATDGGLGYWQPLEWLGSTMGSIQTKKYIGCPNPDEALFLKTGGVKCNFQEITINSKSIKYNVNPMMTGNLFDVSFDGQTAITGRDKRAKRDINYIGLPKLQDLTFEGKIMFEEGGFILLGPWSFDLSSLAPGEQQNKSRELQKTLYQGGENEGKYLSTILIADLTLEPNF